MLHAIGTHLLAFLAGAVALYFWEIIRDAFAADLCEVCHRPVWDRECVEAHADPHHWGGERP